MAPLGDVIRYLMVSSVSQALQDVRVQGVLPDAVVAG